MKVTPETNAAAAGTAARPQETVLNFRTDREYEEEHIRETVQIIEQNSNSYEAQAKTLRADVEIMREHYHDGDTEIWVALNNAITMYENVDNAYRRSVRALKKPYFGRIIFSETEEDGSEKTGSLYIGRSGVSKDALTRTVIDWRAPISNVYYENGLGACTYRSNDGSDITLNLALKRTFDIEDGSLQGYFDSEAATNDELLNKYLARSKQQVLSEIIATIQKEQNDIIRRTPFGNVLVQGAAGSGKTTVAMHRISYILYNFADRVRPEDFYIIGSNEMLLNYITGVLPELDVGNVKQMTMEKLFVRLLYESWEPSKKICTPDPNDESCALRGSSEWYFRLEKYCREYKRKYFEDIAGGADIILDPRQFTEGIENGAAGIYDRRPQTGTADGDRSTAMKSGDRRADGSVCLMSRAYINKVMDDNPMMSLRGLVLLLNSRLEENVSQELLLKDISYTQKEKKAITLYFRHFFGGKKYHETVFNIYDSFLESQGMPAMKRGRGFDVYALAALAMIYKCILEEEVISEAHHIVIDEAQDYGMMAYRVLDRCIRDCTYTVMGDISQNIRYDSGINDWSELKDLMIKDGRSGFRTLRKSYRNTIEISEFATGILDHGSFEVYPTEPIIRHGEVPETVKCSRCERADRIAAICDEWERKGLMTIAVVCRNQKSADELEHELEGRVSLVGTRGPEGGFGNGVMVLPVEMTKGLEFDAVLIAEPSPKDYPADDRHTKLLYVAATRALHELKILVTESGLTGLIADPVPAKKRRHVIADAQEEESWKIPEKEYDAAADIETDKAEIIARADAKRAVQSTQQDVNANKVRQDRDDHGLPVQERNEPVPAQGGPAKNAFASSVSAAELTVPGHGSNSHAVRWVMRQQDGIFMQSRYGVLRIYPISPDIVRITFCKGTVFKAEETGLAAKFSMLKKYGCRDHGNLTDINLGRLSLCVDRGNGVISFRNAAGKEILRNDPKEPRYIHDTVSAEKRRSYEFFDPGRNREFHLYSGRGGALKYLFNNALNVRPDSREAAYIMVKDRFGILPASGDRTVFCSVPAYGTYLMTDAAVTDYYFVLADSTERLTALYGRLTGQNALL